MATELTPQQISVSFVAQYYYILSSNTKNLYKFYKNESEMTHEHSNVVKQLPGNINPNTVVGQDIEKKISTLGYEDCKVRLTFVDSQRSLNGSVFVFVEGVMIRQSDDQKEMNFVQTFLLAEQENGYYVRNDYLRFTSCASSVTPNAVPHQVTTTISQPQPPHQQHHATNTASSDTQVKSQNGSTNATPPQLSFSTNSSVANTAANGSHSPRSETSSTAATAGASSVYGGAEDNQLDEESDHEEPKQSEKKPVVNVPPQSSSNIANPPVASSSTRAEKSSETNKTISYAAAVKNEQNSATLASSTTTVAQEASQQPKRGKKHHKNENKEKTELKEDNKNDQKTENKIEHKKLEHHKMEPKNRKNEHHKSDNDHKKPSSAPASTDDERNALIGEKKTFRGKDHPLNKYAVYVRDLPVGTKDSDLKQIFASYGNVIDINNKSGKDQSYNKYALIFFETKQSVDALLEKPTVNIEGHECPITRYQRKPKPHFTPRGYNNNNAPNPTRQGNERRPQRQRFARAPAQTDTSVSEK